MRRHYLRVYLAFLGIVVLFCIFSSIAWMVAHPQEEERRVFEGVGEIVAELLPAADRPKAELQHAVERLLLEEGRCRLEEHTDAEGRRRHLIVEFRRRPGDASKRVLL